MPIRLNIISSVVFWCLFPIVGLAQEYSFKRYRAENGIPSDMVKACIQDSLGYFWVATDEGLARYDGVRFTTYPKAVHNNYIKGFHQTSAGRLLAYGDQDLLEIRNDENGVHFNTIIPATGVLENDSSISYPKLVFEDSRRRLWVSESQSVVMLRGKTVKRFDFDQSNRTPQFVRSFSFFEDLKGNVYTVSIQGNVFRYEESEDRFLPSGRKLPRDVEFASVIDGTLLIGSLEGLFTAALLADGGFGPVTNRLKTPRVSFVAAMADHKIFIATRETQHYIGDLQANVYVPLSYQINDVNHVYVSREQDLWISGNDGLICMKENLFQSVGANLNVFIEAIAEDSANQKMYYATRSDLYQYDRRTETTTHLIHNEEGYFQALLFTTQGLWMANSFNVSLWTDGQSTQQFDFSKENRFATNLRLGLDRKVWVTIPGHPRVYRIEADMTLTTFEMPSGFDGVINLATLGPEGIYITSSGQDSYLYFKPFNEPNFRNISVPVSFAEHTEFNVTDIDFAEGSIWLATTAGLIRYTNGNVTKISLRPGFAEQAVKSVRRYGKNKLLLTTALGILLYDTETEIHNLFNEGSGLRSNVIGPRGLFIDHEEGVWVGTSKGLCYTPQLLADRMKTPPVRFVGERINGKEVEFTRHPSIKQGDYFSAIVSSITFPEREVTFQYRISPDTVWSATLGEEIDLPILASGAHVLEVRAKKNGPYAWSEVSTLALSVVRPMWQKPWVVILGFVGISTLVSVSFYLAHVQNERKNTALQKLIDKRTEELKHSNEELKALNQEKDSLIGIVAHDLKSPLNQIQGLISLVHLNGKLDDESALYVDKMKDSAVRMNEMITKILDVNAIEAKQLNLKWELVNLSDAMNTVADRFVADALRKSITLNRQSVADSWVMVDRSYMEQIIENLLSNAIKFSPKQREIFLSVTSDTDRVVFEVRDQGPGLTEEDKRRMFGKYERLSARPTDEESSTGLGLSIARKFVKEMHGELWCESQEGRGASFLVSFKRVE